jgi:hypothetical protein
MQQSNVSWSCFQIMAGPEVDGNGRAGMGELKSTLLLPDLMHSHRHGHCGDLRSAHEEPQAPWGKVGMQKLQL